MTTNKRTETTMTDTYAEIDAILNPIKAANPGITNGEIVEHLPKHLRAPFWDRALDRYLGDAFGDVIERATS